MSKSETGKLGENLACDYLKNKGYRIIDRNLRKKWGEIDIIAKSPNGTLTFIEVKTIEYKTPDFDNASESLLSPEDNLTKSKLEKIQRTASQYAGEHPELISDKRGWQIDLISVRVFDGKHRVDHFENI